MAMRAFISYSHADEKALERLHKHLAVLQRDQAISAWFDHAILPGAVLDEAIRSELESSDLFLALLSPDYLASNYCYEKEFEHALALAQAEKLRIVPVIIEPCDWLATPFRQFLALPKEGKPVSEWTNANNAYLDIVTGLRSLTTSPAARSAPAAAPVEGNAPRRVKLKRDFDTIERAAFADEAFATLRDYFRAAATELAQASDDLRTSFEEMSPTAFTCSLVNRASRNRREAHITVHNGKGQRMLGDISYVYERHASGNSSNGGIRVEADEYNLFLTTDSLWGSRNEAPKLSGRQAAEWLWNQFVERAGVEYD